MNAPVEQVDREAAAEVYALLGFGPCQHVIDGVEDDIGVVQAFAAARLAERERCAKVADAYSAEFHGKGERAENRQAEEIYDAHGFAGSNIATAIRSPAHVG